jgi:hypothetical protein
LLPAEREPFRAGPTRLQGIASMTKTANPLAPHDLPWFVTAPGESDTLLVAMGIFLVLVLFAVGNVYFQLHALPERWAHKRSPVQVQIVAILALLALFTHNNVFWIAALLLALVQFPDFATPIYSMADSLRDLAGRRRASGAELDESARPEPESTDADSGAEGRDQTAIVEVTTDETIIATATASSDEPRKGGTDA